MDGTDEADEEKNRPTLTWQDLDRENLASTPAELDSGLRTGTVALPCTDNKQTHMEISGSHGSKNAQNKAKELSVKVYPDAEKPADEKLTPGNAGTSEGPKSYPVESDISVFETLVSDVVTLMLQCQSLHIASADVDTIGKLSSGLKALQAYLKQASRTLKGKLAVHVLQLPGMLGTIWDFSSDIYRSLGTGVSSVLGFCLLMMRNCLLGWCEYSQKVCQSLAEKGVIEKVACELGELRTVPEITEFTKFLILLDLSLEYTLAQYTPSHEQFKEIELINILKAYILCPDVSIRTLSKLTLSHLVPILRADELFLLELTEKEVSCFCETLAAATTSDEHTGKIFDIELSTLDLLNAMSGLAANMRNRELMVQGDVNIVDFIAVVLTTSEEPEIIAATVLLWHLMRDPGICKQISTVKSFIIDQVHELQLNSDDQINNLSYCILETAGHMGMEDIPTILGIAKTHYQYHKYESCMKLCDHIQQNKDSKENNSAKLLKGKALFHVYRGEQEDLQAATLSVKEYHLRRLSCYKKASEVVSLLGNVLDHGYIDDDGSFCLDQAMIDHLREVNSKDRHRCLLCRRKAKLHRSHAWPESLLQAFTSGLRTDTGKTRKVFDCKKIGNSKAAGELTSWMLCTACEHILSSQAETDFAKKFFHRIYDPSYPSRDRPKQAQSIEYEEWLYCFCISIIFRGIVRVGILGHSCSGSIYELFQQCRKFLLQSHSDRTTAQSETLQIGLLIGPTMGSATDQGVGFINQVLHMPGLFVMSKKSLADGSTRIPLRYNFFLAHCGIINIVVEFSKKHTLCIPSSCYISCQGGQYFVPEDEKRTIPKGIWTEFLKLAQEFEAKWLERSAKFVLGKLNTSYVEPKPEKRDTFMLVQAAKADVKAVYSQVHPSDDTTSPKVVNLLPQQFLINRRKNQPSSVTLPHGHKIILHKHFVYDEGLNETLFLAVGRENEYTIEKPYVIFHHSIPGLQFHIGFFISPDDFTAQDFLPDNDPKFNLDKIVQSCNARSIIHKAIANMLEEKGFSSYYSILHRIRDQSKLPNLDQKCAHQNRCWYCQDLCENCFEFAAAGLASLAHNGTLLRFCSESCKEEFQLVSSKAPLVVTSQTFLTRLPSLSCVPSGHRELLQVHAHGTTPKQEPFKITLNVCIADGSDCFPPDRPYIMYHLRSVFHQQFLEFFISPTLVPEEPVPYCTSDASVSAVNQLKADKYIQRMLKGALNSQGFHELSLLVQVEKETRVRTERCFLDGDAVRESSFQQQRGGLEDVASKVASRQLLPSEIPETPVPTISADYFRQDPLDQKIHFIKLFKDVLELIRTYQLEAAVASSQCVELSIRINQAVNGIHSVLNSASVQLVGELGDFMAEVPAASKTLLHFTRGIYNSLSQGVDFVLIDSLLKVRIVLSQTPGFSHNLADKLAESGWIFQMIHEIQEVKDTLEQSEAQKHFLQLLLVLNFGILLKCSWNKKHHVQFEDAKFLENIRACIGSPVASIRAMAVFTLSSLTQFFTEEQCNLLLLTNRELEHILIALTQALNSNYPVVECFDLKFSRERLVFMLNKLCISPQNRQKMIQNSILGTITLFMEKGQEVEQEKALELLWTLAEEPSIREQLVKKCRANSLLLNMLASGVAPALRVLSGCILWAINPGEVTETEACLEYIHGCYQYQKYTECMELCNKLIESSDITKGSKDDAKLYKAKALFHLYRNQQKLLKNTSQSVSHEQFHEMQKLCHRDNKEVITLLGYLLDQKLISVENKASEMLDLAMIDYIWETNDLKSCERCLLCRKKAQLRRSYLFPKALLDSFTSEITLPEDRKIFLYDRYQKDPVESPQESVFWMFCNECEELLNSHGETQFACDFFRKIYDTSDPERPEKEQEIYYGKWLYQFALGTVFRGLAQKKLSTSSFVNESDVYQLFLQCRHCLQNINCLDEIGDKPSVAILVNPTSVSSGAKAGFINQVLHMATLFNIASFQLSDGLVHVPIRAEFFLAKIGIIHFIVNFNTADCATLPPETYINPLGGTYKVPEDNSRHAVLPVGIWSLLNFHANELLRAYQESPVYHVEATCRETKLVQPSQEVQRTFMSEESAATEAETIKSSSERLDFPGSFLVVNLLPQDFVLSRSSGTLVLPDSHKILLHATVRQSAGDVEETLFLAAGSDAVNYIPENMYLIYNCNEPSMQLSIGFLISANDLSVTEILPKSSREHVVAELFIKQARGRLNKLLPEILKAKGVFSLHSLKHRMIITGDIPCVDFRCVPRCWYCNGLCDSCLQPTVVGLAVVTKQELLLKFCSDQCQKNYCGAKELTVNAELSKLEDRRELLMQVHAIGVTPLASFFNVKMQIYHGSGSYDISADRCYVMYQFRSPFTQELLEFFISSDLTPSDPLPYLTSEQAMRTLQLTKESGLVQSILQKAFEAVKISNLCDLVHQKSMHK